MTTIAEVLNNVFEGESWKEFSPLTKAFKGDELVTAQGREHCPELDWEVDFYEIGNGTRFCIDGRLWTVI